MSVRQWEGFRRMSWSDVELWRRYADSCKRVFSETSRYIERIAPAQPLLEPAPNRAGSSHFRDRIFLLVPRGCRRGSSPRNKK
jgi:hypothetical protein